MDIPRVPKATASSADLRAHTLSQQRLIGDPKSPIENVKVRAITGVSGYRVHRIDISCPRWTIPDGPIRPIWRVWDYIDNPNVITMDRQLGVLSPVLLSDINELIDKSALSDEQIAQFAALVLTGVIK